MISKSASTKALTVDALIEDKGVDYLSLPEVTEDLSYIIISGMCENISEYIGEDRQRHIHLELKNINN